MFTMETTSNLELMLRRWMRYKGCKETKKSYIKAIKDELKLRK